VRELQHVIERAVLLAPHARVVEDDIDLGASAVTGSNDSSFRSAKARCVEQFERSFIEQRLLESDGNVTLAAREARKNRRAFFELMRKHAIEPERFRPST
jgi:two-component system response regulator GlrR